ncbi:MAG: phosphomannomutase, partial [Alphaproteobacteria bacterium]|nr:phosphomannomutase [Alphaproteobacteria bacterium]
MTSYRFDHSILRQYDVRGIVDKTLFPESALLLGGLLAEIIKGEDANPTVVIGGDGRLSTPKLKSAL